MREVSVNVATTLVKPAGATNVLITHEWGDIVANYVAVPGANYSFTPDSLGLYRIFWVNGVVTTSVNAAAQANNPVQLPITTQTGSQLVTTFAGLEGPSGYASGTTTATVVSTDQFIGAMQLLPSSEFFADIAILDTGANEDSFIYVERLVRLYIERYTQQKFGPYINKTMSVQGEGGDDLPLTIPLLSLRSIQDNQGNDLTQYVQVSTTSPYFIHHVPSTFFLDNSVSLGYIDRKRDVSYRGNKQYFSNKLYFLVTGDFGYYFVPQDIAEAAKLIIADTFSGAQDLRRAGVQEAQLGDYRYILSKSGDGTTGNLIADQLLAPYININLGWA